MNVDAYIKAANRGDFKWQPFEVDNWTGQVLEEGCTYKGKEMAVKISSSAWDNFEVEIDLENEPYSINVCRASRKSAREFAERVIRNDMEGNWQKNLKYAVE